MAKHVLVPLGDGDAGRIAARYLAARFDGLSMIAHSGGRAGLAAGSSAFGWLTVAGQVAFIIVQRIQQRLSHRRIQAICARFDLDTAIPDTVTVISVGSVNSAECIDYLKRLDPASSS